MRTPRRRSVLIFLLLGTAFVLSAVTTTRELMGERQHEALARGVVRDYAAIIADDLLRRTVYEFETFAFRPLRGFIGWTLEQSGHLPTKEELYGVRDAPWLREAAPVVDGLFIADFKAGTIQPHADSDFDRWIVQNLERIAADSIKTNTHQVIVANIGGRDRVIVYGISELERRRVWGFTARDTELHALAQRAFGRRNVFTPIVGRGQLSNRDVFIHISRGEFELLRTPGTFNPSTGVRFPMPAGFEDIFGRATVEISIAPRAIPYLIAGGVPRPRVAASIITLLITGASLVTAAWVLRRERQLEHARLDFVAGVSHELRTPLTQIRMFAQTLLLGRVRTEAEKQKSLLIIDQETSRLTNLVDNLLFLARGERNDVAIYRRPIDVSAVALEAVHTYAPLAESQRVTLVPHVNSAAVASADDAAIKQVITNLLDNAVKYGPAGQTIDVRVDAQNGHVRLSVDDQGPGIPASDRETIFDKFYRLDRDTGTHKAGSGIGLAVVREIVTRHEGRCWVESAPGGGARFVVELPAEQNVA